MLIDKNSPYVALEIAKKKGVKRKYIIKTLYNYIHISNNRGNSSL